MTFLVYWILFNEHIYLAHLIMTFDLIKFPLVTFYAVTDPITTFNWPGKTREKIAIIDRSCDRSISQKQHDVYQIGNCGKGYAIEWKMVTPDIIYSSKKEIF